MKYILSLIMVVAAMSATAQTTTVNNWTASDLPVKSDKGLCWQNSFWTPQTALKGCVVETKTTDSKNQNKPVDNSLKY